MIAALFALAAPTLAAGVPAFDPRQHKNNIAGPPAQVLVLGSPHLSQLPNKLDPKLLEPLLTRLAAFKPDVITVEGLSGEECEILLRFKAKHGGAWDDYCWPTADVEKLTGLTVAQAEDEIDRTLKSWPKDPTPAQRRHLALLFLAANDRSSAAVQWLRLPEAERRAADGLNQAMVDVIERKGRPLNENVAIGAALAARLGLERIYPVDDHIADGRFDQNSAEGKAYAAALQAAWKSSPPPRVRVEADRLEANLKTGSDLVGYYRLLNNPESQRQTISSDMGAAARTASSQPYGRQYLAWWESRNLRMVANIRSSFDNNPGARVLAIVGATHKGYFDAYLDMMQDVRIVDAMQFLR